MRVLEDEPPLARQLAAALGEAGYAVDCAAEGERAEFLGQTERYDADRPAPPARDRAPTGWPADSSSGFRGLLQPCLAGGHGAVLGHPARQPGLDDDLRQLAGPSDAFGEVVVGPEVVVLEKLDGEPVAPFRVDALHDLAVDDDR